jgi:hypothetical protein
MSKTSTATTDPISKVWDMGVYERRKNITSIQNALNKTRIHLKKRGIPDLSFYSECIGFATDCINRDYEYLQQRKLIAEIL